MNKIPFGHNNISLKLTLVSVFTLIIMTGCTKPFQPPPPEYKLWEKNGANSLDIKKALLECGAPSTKITLNSYKYAFGIELEEVDKRLNKGFLMHGCMENAGFISRSYSFKQYCSWQRHQHLPVCQPGAQIPKPSVERRLNSWYCQKNRINVKKCQNKEIESYLCEFDGYAKILPECKP